MDKYIEKRFEYLKEKSVDELKEELNELKEELDSMKKDLEEKKVSGYRKSDIENSDIPYTRDKIIFIEEELSKKM